MITVPKFSEIRDQIITDIETALGQNIPLLPKAFFRVLAGALAGVLMLLYRFGAWNYYQIFPQTAGGESLELIGGQYGLVRGAPVAAIVEATAGGTDGTLVPAGTLWQYNGIVYSQTAGATITAGVAAIEIESLTASADSTRLAGDIMRGVSPILGVNDNAVVTATTTSGADIEDLEIFRGRVIFRLQQRPQGGVIADYIGWATEVPGIVRAFAFNTADGEVTVYPLQSLTADRIPDSAKLLEVETYLNDESRKPLCATVLADAMTESDATVTVSSLVPDNADLRIAIQEEWSKYFLGAFPLQFADETSPTNTVSVAGLYAAAIKAGAVAITATLAVAGTPGTVASYTLADNEIIILDTLTWPT